MSWDKRDYLGDHSPTNHEHVGLSSVPQGIMISFWKLRCNHPWPVECNRTRIGAQCPENWLSTNITKPTLNFSLKMIFEKMASKSVTAKALGLHYSDYRYVRWHVLHFRFQFKYSSCVLVGQCELSKYNVTTLAEEKKLLRHDANAEQCKGQQCYLKPLHPCSDNFVLCWKKIAFL